jgi:hypothetical protein
MTADTLRRSAAEARQEEAETVECPMCRATVAASEAWECPDCGQHYCPTCKPLVVTVCWECFDREDAFDEVAEIEAEAKDASS